MCSTLSFAGSSVFYRLSKKFDVVIIDEAAQAVEPSVLVPMVMGCRQVRARAGEEEGCCGAARCNVCGCCQLAVSWPGQCYGQHTRAC